jgi:uncharacterized protein (TIGR02118 family)
MSISYFVRYDINAPDVDAFVAYYRTKHVPILSRWPGMKRVVLHTPAECDDLFATNRGKTVLLAQLEFDSMEDLEMAMGSAERVEARQDFKNFPQYQGQVLHQAMQTEEAWRKP